MIATMYKTTPLGTMLLGCDEHALAFARFVEPDAREERGIAMHPLLVRAAAVLERYFECGELDPSLPLAPAGTTFQRAVWARIARVGCGDTMSYRDIAMAVGEPRSARAVGAATGRNPLCIFVPCHRVVGHDGALTGYAWGLDRKRALLAMEREFAARARRAA